MLDYVDCGNTIENNSHLVPVADASNCSQSFPSLPATMPCRGDSDQTCGGPNLIYIYGLPASGLVPLFPYGPDFDNFPFPSNQESF